MRDFVPIPYGHRGGVYWPRPTKGRLSTHSMAPMPTAFVRQHRVSATAFLPHNVFDQIRNVPRAKNLLQSSRPTDAPRDRNAYLSISQAPFRGRVTA